MTVPRRAAGGIPEAAPPEAESRQPRPAIRLAGNALAPRLARLRSGWTLVALICLAVLVLWLPDINLPLGNSDDGRILGRFGLQARNFWDLGPIESRFGAVMEPFIRAEYDVAPRTEPPLAAVTYAHHPPLPIFIAIASVRLLGDSLPALRIAAFVMGSATVAFMALLLRVRNMAWGPTLVAVTAMACTGFFYVYARGGNGYWVLVASTAAVAWLREVDHPPRWTLVGTAVLAALSALQTWIAMATLALLVPWLFAGTLRRARSTTAPADGTDNSGPPTSRRPRIMAWLAAGWSPGLTALIVGAAAGAAITAGWLLNATDAVELSERVSFRAGTDVKTVSEQTNFTFGEFLARQWRFASHELLAPPWLRALLVPALVAGAMDRRTRAPMLITLAFAATLPLGLQQGAWVHRLWNFPWLAPLTVGLAALADAVRRILRGGAARLRLPAGILAAVVAVTTLFFVVTGGTRDFYLSVPADAGAVLDEARTRVDAEAVWVTPGIPTPRWVSYYMDAPVFTLDEGRLGEVAESDVVLLRSNRVPDYFPEGAVDDPIASRGIYRLITADRLIE